MCHELRCPLEQACNRFDCDDLTMEDAAEVTGDSVCYGRQGRRSARRRLRLKRTYLAVCDATGNDPFEITQIGRDIQSEAMGGDCLGNMNTNSSYFALQHCPASVGPDTRAPADSLGRYTEILAREDEGFLHEADEVDGAKMGSAFSGKLASKVEDGVADKLPGAMVSDIPATVDLVYLYALARQQIVTGEDVCPRSIAAQREHGRVLHQQQSVPDEPRPASIEDLPHHPKSSEVGDAAKLE